MNRNGEKKLRQPNPISTASILSRITFWWLKPMFTIGLQRAIEEDDIYAVTNSLRSDQNTEAFQKLWQLELKKPKPSIFRVMFKLHGFKVLSLGLLYSTGETLAKLIQPICLGGLVSYFAQSDDQTITLTDAYWFASGIVFSTAFILITFHPFILCIFKTSCKVRVACSGLIYQKSLRLLKSSSQEGQNGQIINLLSSDLAKFEYGLGLLYEIWKGPMQTLLFLVVIYIEIGIAGVAGMAFLASLMPLQLWIGRKSAHLRMKSTVRTDFRIRIMNEILLGIQVIKMYAWEKSFAKLVDEIRRKEVNAIRSIANVSATINTFGVVSKVSIFLSLISYVYLGNVITARKVFIVSSYFSILDLSMLLMWPLALTHAAEAYVSIHRLQEFLLRPESKQSARKIEKLTNGNSKHENSPISKKAMFDKKRNKSGDIVRDHENIMVAFAPAEKPSLDSFGRRIQNLDTADKIVRFESATAVWERSESHQVNGIFDLNLELKPGLCAIVGQVGSGKSTLLNIILGELELDSGTVTVNGSISYASQEPWLFGGTVRSNIIFVEDFDAHRYSKVVEVCALERDFKLLPQGDATIVGEQGSSLSGGQKARINLARAIYKRSDIYLLDDPLSAVDTHVGKHIFERCIEGFLADKICVLVTHQLQYLKNVDHVVLMKNGKIEAEGPFETLQSLNKESLMCAQEDSDHNAATAIQNRIRKHSSTTSFCSDDIEDDPEDRKEHQQTGAMKFSTYKAFFAAANSNTFALIVFIVFVAGQLAWSGGDFFLSEWVDWEESIGKSNSTEQTVEPLNLNATKVSSLNTTNIDDSDAVSHERNEYLIIYTSIMVYGIIAYLARAFSFYRLCLRISINLHDMIFRGVTRAKMIFFNNNPSGRILNRFARDINNVDSLLPNIIFEVTDCFFHYVAIVFINIIVNPWLLVPSMVMTILFYLLRSIYINTGRGFKRIEALSRSPIFSHVNATLQGLSTVRAFNASKMLEKEFHEFQDHNTSCWYVFSCASRWFAFWLDVVCLLFIASVTYSFLILADSMNMQSGQVGLAILSSINLIGLCEWGMRQSAELENQMTSVERLIEYAELPSEPPLESDAKNAPPKDWPQYGNIEFKSLSLRYTENGHRILRSLTFRIEAKQKVGVVGRTGAGKSSIIQSLFRLAQNEGHIFIDGVDVGVIGLHDLRKKISIIPQEAILFSETLRFNLDPFGERTDAELWSSLDQVELRTVVSTIPGGLDCKVLDGGSNFSAGQRQMLCLARAILRNNKILILDEATANVDSHTDQLIQQTIRRQFADCTVITIAHRLNTVMDSDKVLVVDAGEIVEFDHPFELIRKDGFFKQLLDQTGSSAATALTLIAKESYEKQKKDL